MTAEPGYATSFSATIPASEIEGGTGANLVLLLARLETAMASIDLPVSREYTRFSGQDRVVVTTLHKPINSIDYSHRVFATITADGQTVEILIQSWQKGGEKATEEIPKEVFERLRKALKK